MTDTLEVDEPPCGTDLPRDLYNDLLCPICLEFFKHPIILPCSHVLCRSPCAENLFDFNFIRCPVCRENCYVSGGIGSLPRVIPLESIIDKYRSERRKAVQGARKAQKKAAAAAALSSSQHRPCAGHSCQTAHHVAGCAAAHAGTQSGHGHVVSCAHSETQSSNGGESRSSSSSSSNGRCGLLTGADSAETPLSSSEWQQTTRGSSLADFGSASGNNRDPLSPSPTPVSRTLLPARSDPFSRPAAVYGLSSSSSSTPRTLDRFDASLFDLSTDSVTSCSRHGSEASVYCQACERCVCDVCGDGDHVTSHVTNSLEDAAFQAKGKLAQNLEKMTNSQKKVLSSLEQQRHQLKDLEQSFHRRTEEINTQCDSLLAEVEHKRSLFLADLEHEERMRRGEVEDVIEILEKFLASSQSLAQYTKEFLEKDNASILQVTPALNEQLLASIQDCEACQGSPDNLYLDPLPGKVVDFRKEQTLLRGIRYLSPPATPSVDLGRCARSENTVALFVVPARDSDVTDSFVIRYCSEDQKALGIEESLTLEHNPTSTTTITTTTASSNTICGSGDDDRSLSQWIATTSANHHHPQHHSQHASLLHEHPHRIGASSSSSSSSPSLCSPFSSAFSSSVVGLSVEGVVVLLENLLSGTPYLFCVSAVNRAGSSDVSQAVQCVTLPYSHSVVPVPVILEAMCHTYSTSIRVYSPSPRDVAPQQSISHFLLHRPRDRKCVWRCLPLRGQVDGTVYGLEPCTRYEFVVMATNPRGECQISQTVVLETDNAEAS